MMSDLMTKPRRYPRGGDPVEVFHTRLCLTEEVPKLKQHADRLNLTTSAALRDIFRRGVGLPSIFDDQQP